MISITGAWSEECRNPPARRQLRLPLRKHFSGPLIDEAALIAAVKAGKIIAALDVYDREPLPEGHPLRVSDHTVLTPHLGYGVVETWRDFYPRSIENAEAFLDGKPVRVLNAP